MDRAGMRSPGVWAAGMRRCAVVLGTSLVAIAVLAGVDPGAGYAKTGTRRLAPAKGRSHPARRRHALRLAKAGTVRQARRAPARRAPRPAHRALAAHRTVRHVAPPEPQVPSVESSPVVALAFRLVGRPYRFGGDHGAFDCSGLVRRVFARVGLDLPHSARAQFTLGDRVGRDDLEPGDLVFFHASRRYATHVGIYVGNDQFVHAATHGGQVQVDSLDEAYFARHYLGARRLEI